MNYLVTGGAGFIGSHIAQTLLERGETVRILDNFSAGKRENIEALTRDFDSTRLEIMEGDIRDASPFLLYTQCAVGSSYGLQRMGLLTGWMGSSG